MIDNIFDFFVCYGSGGSLYFIGDGLCIMVCLTIIGDFGHKYTCIIIDFSILEFMISDNIRN